MSRVIQVIHEQKSKLGEQTMPHEDSIHKNEGSSTLQSNTSESLFSKDPKYHGGEAYHGGLNASELRLFGIHIEQAIDFSSNILPNGPSPKLLEAMQKTNLAPYPDRDCMELREAIAGHYQLASARILVGNGCCELIHLVARTLIRLSDLVLVVGPTFSEYERSSHLAGARTEFCLSSAGDDFRVPVDLIQSQLSTGSYKVVWICNPNNPTGQYLGPQHILKWVQQFPGTFFVIDESYIEFAKKAKSVIGYTAANLIVLRSMTKVFGMAGLRLGFAHVSEDLYERLCEQRVPWAVNSPAQKAGIAALQDREFYSLALEEIYAAKAELFRQLQSLGLRPIASDTNFFLMPIDRFTNLRASLLAEGIVIRDCTSFGLPDFVRVAVLDQSHNKRLVDLLARIVRNQPECSCETD